jgi:MoxR-like ATPase
MTDRAKRGGFITWRPGVPIHLGPQGGLADQVHLFEDREVIALNAALAAGRPLLVRGEPGVGKSQLARAAAAALGRAFVQHVVDSQTESRDLMWRFDALGRLGEAQLAGALRGGAIAEAEIRARLEVARFVRPGPLWWAFDWAGAADQARVSRAPPPPGAPDGAWKGGCVVLIDEIDKAESEVPNGLLEALGSGEFTPPEWPAPVRATAPPPLVVITSNDERALPNAFMRRCLVLRLDLPADDEALKARLIERGRAHFPAASEGVLAKAADLLIRDRRDAGGHGAPRPGQAEYLDLARAVLTQYPDDEAEQERALAEVGEYTLRKYGPRPA